MRGTSCRSVRSELQNLLKEVIHQITKLEELASKKEKDFQESFRGTDSIFGKDELSTKFGIDLSLDDSKNVTAKEGGPK